MGIGVSIFLIALGAILTFAVHATFSGVSIQTIGVILMIAGALGLIVTMLVFAPRRRAGAGVVEERVYDDRPATY
jgi:Flp pilus assembly protein protease CpaA